WQACAACASPARPEEIASGPESSFGSEVSQRIHGGSVDAHLEVEVRAEAMAGAADVADHLALRHMRAAADREAGLVGIRGREAVAVVDDDDVSVALLPAGDDHRSGRGRVDRRAGGGADVDALV